MAEFVTVTRSSRGNGNYCTIAINNPKKLNTLSSQILEELEDEVKKLVSDQEIRAVVLTGTGDRAFVGGANIYEMAELNPETARVFITRIHTLCTALRDLPVPVIARVNGFCLGAGMEIAAVCDLIIAEESAEFSMPEVRVGIPSVIEAAVLPRLLGSGLARDLVITGRALNGKEAADAGFVQRLAESGKLDEAVGIALDEIMAGGREAIRLQKILCNFWEEENMSKSVQFGIDMFAKSFEGPEPAEMLGAFTKRKR
ncbi:enoyl-CoA hydratase [Sneathiella sp. P13V-1]|uniref:enoyl-CoA hydratase n=1 Tax=Sneathiella sp. P13V-1 TaxID=2697366 RepID=UPI00187B98E7|nr:enoyl-CoA hydratase [Sneathiella sp. P13V-1]MBE7635500.1 enoyl-CoA hydratase [Sneathiella sp. P13V-1]